MTWPYLQTSLMYFSATIWSNSDKNTSSSAVKVQFTSMAIQRTYIHTYMHTHTHTHFHTRSRHNKTKDADTMMEQEPRMYTSLST